MNPATGPRLAEELRDTVDDGLENPPRNPMIRAPGFGASIPVVISPPSPTSANGLHRAFPQAVSGVFSSVTVVLFVVEIIPHA